MNGPISTLPSGLLGMLGIKNAGRNPASLAEFYQPTLDLARWLGDANAQELITGNLGLVNTVGQNYSASLRVPGGQCWYLRGALSDSDVNDTEALVGQLCLSRYSAGSLNPVITGPICGMNSGLGAPGGPSAGGVYCPLNGPLLMFPDDILVLNVSVAVTVGGMQTFINAYINRFTL